MGVAQKDMMQIAASLADFERVEAVGMKSATLPEKVDALLRDLVHLRRKEREWSKERDALRVRLAEVERERDLLSAWLKDADTKRDERNRKIATLSGELFGSKEVIAAMHGEVKLLRAERDDARRVAKRLAGVPRHHERIRTQDEREAQRAALAYEVEP